MTGIRILKAARRVPDFTVTNGDMAKIVDTSDEWVYSRTGIKERHVSKGETTAQTASGVLRLLLEGSGVSAGELDLLILSTVTPDYLTPQSSAYVLHENGCRNAFAFDMNAACTGFVYALSVADKMLRSGLYKTAAVISADTLTKLTDWSDRGTCVLFGDGAGGVIMRAEEGAPGILAEDLHTDGEKYMCLRGGKLPVNNAWHKDESPAEPYVIMDGKEVFNFAVSEVPRSVRNTLEKAGLTMDDIKYVVPHQANSRIIDGIAKKLKTDRSKFYTSIHKYGNTSSSSMPIALSEMTEQGLLSEGDRIIITGFGAGLTWGSILYQF